MMIKTPVVMIGYARVRTLALSLNRLASSKSVLDRDLYLFLDAPACGDHAGDCERMFNLSMSIKEEKLPKLNIIRRETNYGVPKNQIASISEVLAAHGRCIFFEDDILVSDTFLDYMDEALELYRSDKRIFCING